MNTILIAALVLGGAGLVLGLGLSWASVKFHVKEDPRLKDIIEALPGANCAGCGYPGCGGFAKAVLEGKVKPDACPPGGAAAAEAIGKIMGVEVSAASPKNAFIRCGGGISKSRYSYDYDGMESCMAASQLAAGGPKSCAYGCLGLKDCVRACPFDAIEIADGIARVLPEKCAACGVCVPACPKNLIDMVPTKALVRVVCHTPEPAKTVRGYCDVGCIGCKLCVKACNYDAINMESALAAIDYEKCNNCTDCVGKCPVRCIIGSAGGDESL